MNTNKVKNQKVTIKTVDYETFEQVTTAGDVIEIIRNEILSHHERALSPDTPSAQKIRENNKRHGLEMALDAITLTEAKMKAWQELKGPEPMTTDEYKQLANGAVYFHDNVKGEGRDPAASECDHCGRVRDPQALSGLCERCENENNS